MPADRQRKLRATRLKRKRIPGYTPEYEVAEELSVSVRLLRKWRAVGLGPPYIEFARQFHYGDDGRAAWLRSLERKPVRVP